MLDAASLFDLTDFDHADIFADSSFSWSALNRLKAYMDSYDYPPIDRALISDARPLAETVILHEGRFYQATDLTIDYDDVTKGKLRVSHGTTPLPGATVIMAGALLLGERVALGKGVLIESGAMIKSPAIIGDCTEIRQAAYLRGHCLAGKRCVIGHATEVKHSIFLNDAKAGHFAYLGDSILGTNVNLGAGTKFANLKMVPGNVIIHCDGARHDTGRRKFGAILGDGSQTGCNSVTNPGTIFGRRCLLMPNTTTKGTYYPENSRVM
ncbi:MAG: hypothetical protein ACK5PS_18345 [Desulfopila sp.]